MREQKRYKFNCDKGVTTQERYISQYRAAKLRFIEMRTSTLRLNTRFYWEWGSGRWCKVTKRVPEDAQSTAEIDKRDGNELAINAILT